jgi:uncharacterized oxidoreductase
MNDVTLSAAQWRSLCQHIFCSWGAPEDIAACVTDSLVGSDLAGVHSHGLLRIPSYYTCVKRGWYDPAGRPTVLRESAVMALIDGHWGFGQVAMHRGLKLGIAKAREQGIAGVGVIHAGHVGRLGEYVEGAAAAGMIALMGTSSGGNVGIVAPYGGRERALSTNPIAAAVPARNHPPFIMDFATTVVAAGKVELAPDQDMPIPEGWAVNAEGYPARTPAEVVQGGAMLPFAGHKGYALMLLTELLAGGLTGAGLAGQKEKTRPGSNASFLIVINAAHFTDTDGFYADVDGLFDRLKAVKPAAGFKEVLIPGEPEAAARVRKAQEGITVEGPVWAEIVAIAAERGVNLDEIPG